MFKKLVVRFAGIGGASDDRGWLVPSGSLARQGIGSFYLEIPFEDRLKLSKGQVDVSHRDFLSKSVRTDVSELANSIGVGIESVGEMPVLDDALDQVLQGSGVGRLLDVPLVHVPN